MPLPSAKRTIPVQTSAEVTEVSDDILGMISDIPNPQYTDAILKTLQLPGITREQLALLRVITMALKQPDSNHALWIAELNTEIRIPLLSRQTG